MSPAPASSEPTGTVRARRSAAALVLVALSLTGCGKADVVVTGPSFTGTMKCDRPDRPPGMLVLMAQSIPAASAVPCLRNAPESWSMTQFNIESGHSLLTFTYETGSGADTATIEMTPSCNLQGASEVSSEQAGIQRYDRSANRSDVYAEERYYVYPGACTTLRFNLTGAGIISSLRGAELASELSFVGRQTLDQRVRELSHGRLHLDPEQAK